VVHPHLRLRHTISEAISDSLIKLIAGFYGFLVALSPVRELLFCAKHLFAAAMVTITIPGGQPEQWDFFSPEFYTGLSFNPDGKTFADQAVSNRDGALISRGAA
jgi:hypothetical protein